MFDNGVYTACAPCKDDPKKPPLWQVKGARIIHNQTEKMLCFENAQLEFFGVPTAYLPYILDARSDRETQNRFPDADPRVRNSTYGLRHGNPYYWAIASDMDATFNPRITSKQGVLLQTEFRQRFMDGLLSIRLYGIDQLDRGQFTGQPGDRDFRWGVDTKGQFALNDKMGLGLRRRRAVGLLLHVRRGRLAQYKDPFGSFLSPPTESDLVAPSDRRRRPKLL